MTRPLWLGAPVDMHTSACSSFMPNLHTNQTWHTHTKGLLLSSLQPAHTPLQQARTSWVPFTQTVWGFPPSCLRSITLSAIFPVPRLGKMEKLIEKHTYALCKPSQHFQVIWYGSSAGVQPLTPDLSQLLGTSELAHCKVWQANRRGVTPVSFHFWGSSNSLVLSNGHYSRPSYRSKIPVPKIEEYKNSIDWAMRNWNYF